MQFGPAGRTSRRRIVPKRNRRVPFLLAFALPATLWMALLALSASALSTD